MRIVFDFIGREANAIGAMSHYVAAYDADTYQDAVRRLYEEYDDVCPLRSWTASVAGLTLAHGEGWDTYPKAEG